MKHQEAGTSYGKEGAFEYRMVRDRPDGIFLYKPLIEYLQAEDLHGKRIADIGAGRAPWSIWAAQQGAEVFASDIDHAMVLAAQEAVASAHVEGVHIVEADAAKLPYPDATFDKALSVQVACNLPTGSFEQHFAEMARILKTGGEAILTAPTRFGMVFTSGKTL